MYVVVTNSLKTIFGPFDSEEEALAYSKHYNGTKLGWVVRPILPAI